MAVKEVLRMGNPLLLQVAEPRAEFNTAALDPLIADMFDTIAARTGAGLGGPDNRVSRGRVWSGETSVPRLCVLAADVLD